MKKIALLALLCIGLTHQASAILGIKIGPEVGLNVSNVHTDGGLSLDTKSLTGLRAGLVADFHVYKPIYLQVGALYSIQGATEKASLFGVPVIDQQLKINYLNIPVSLMYKHDLIVGKIFVGVGPYFGVALNGKIKDAIAATSDAAKFGSNSTDDLKRMDVGLGFNAGFQLKLGAFIRFQYQLGLSDLSPNAATAGSLKNGNFSVSLGWLFL